MMNLDFNGRESRVKLLQVFFQFEYFSQVLTLSFTGTVYLTVAAYAHSWILDMRFLVLELNGLMYVILFNWLNGIYRGVWLTNYRLQTLSPLRRMPCSLVGAWWELVTPCTAALPVWCSLLGAESTVSCWTLWVLHTLYKSYKNKLVSKSLKIHSDILVAL